MKIRTVGIFLFDDVEVLDFAGPFEVFAVTVINRFAPDEFAPFDVTTVSEHGGMITARNGLKVMTDHSFQTAPDYDILVIPGGMGTRREVHNLNVIKWIQERMEQVELMTSVCTGSFLLAEAALLDGKSATTHWASINRMRETYPSVAVQENIKFVDAGSIISSAGISAGIHMAFHVVHRLLGQEVAQGTAKDMEYDITFD
ncbi:DJ-1/PfpI family protein [Paenibacillus sp. DMB20]|uniref:DJ-1/PfpI family protein n=1 Tax=Paenibacillus sp. DMB20 TaxID=1642570 RepID=UPI000627797C|nr:DJ-1/PfpI family protein [Paenibacillus sp. DMB20]KKO52865.1 AraC family transcriptional regulator [Paenibacillus sp. DMB20]KKO53769.1 AraC family transcriptional regulator [Paenibacillus sp. DMB20]